MYKRILVAVEHSAADRTILDHVKAVAHMCAAEVLLVHVADGWAARHMDDLEMRESEEIRDDRAYLAQLVTEFGAEDLSTTARLECGDPATELVRVAREEHVDLVAMATHGHRGIADLLHGSTADRVRHALAIPVLLLRSRA